MHARCSDVYSTSCEHAARQAASATQQTRRCNCKAPLRLLVVERGPARRVLERVQRLQFAVNRSTRNFCEIRVQKKRVRLTTVTASWTNELHLTAHGLSDSRQFFDAPAAANQHNLPASQHHRLRLSPPAGAFIFSRPQDALTLFSLPPPLRVAESEPSSDRASPRTVLC